MYGGFITSGVAPKIFQLLYPIPALPCVCKQIISKSIHLINSFLVGAYSLPQGKTIRCEENRTGVRIYVCVWGWVVGVVSPKFSTVLSDYTCM